MKQQLSCFFFNFCAPHYNYWQSKKRKKYMMEKKLFDSQTQASTIINHLFQLTHTKAFENQSRTLCQSPLAKHITNTEFESIQQIRSTRPSAPFLCSQDSGPNNEVTDPIRPFSAKVHRRAEVPQYQSNLLGGLLDKKDPVSTKTIANSRRSIRKIAPPVHKMQKKRVKKGKDLEDNQLIAIGKKLEPEDECDQYIDYLRQRKNKTQDYKKNKENFMKSILKDKQDYLIEQKKFSTANLRKDIIYTSNCAVVELIKQKNAPKKKSRNLQNLRTSTRKSEENSSEGKNILISYSGDHFVNEQRKTMFDEGKRLVQAGQWLPVAPNSHKFDIIVESEGW